MGNWKNRHDKPFDCKWTNDKIFTLSLWIGNKDTTEMCLRNSSQKSGQRDHTGNPENFHSLGGYE